MADSTIIMPLSGEIMADDAFAGARRERPHDIVDAEYETLTRPPPNAIPLVQPPVVDKPGMDLLRDGKTPAGSARGGVGFWGTGVLAAFAAFWMSGGHTLSRHLPGNDGGTVRVSSLASRVAETAAGPRLFIDGAVENTASAATRAPELTIKVTGRDGAVTRYRIAAAGQTIASGAAWKFSSRIDAPHAGVRSVSVIIAEEKRGS